MPVSASGDIATRSSIAMRISSAQSMSSGAAVTRPSAKRGVGIERLARLAPARRRSGRLLAVEAALQAALAGDHRVARRSWPRRRRSSARAPRRRAAPACRCGRRRAPARASVPAKHEPGSISANRLRDDTSSRLKRAAQQADRSRARTSGRVCAQQRLVQRQHARAASPSVLSSHGPMSSSLVRIDRIASSSSRASASGYQAAPAASMPAMSVGCAPVGAFTVKRGGAARAVDLRPSTCA